MSTFSNIARGIAVWSVLLVGSAAALAQPAKRPIRETFIVESDGTAERKLAAVADYVAQERWDTAVALLREVATSRPDAVVRVSPRHSLSLPTYCDVLLTRLPAEGLAAYRRGADAQAAAWVEEARQLGDEHSLRSVIERAFASSSGDDALFALGERAWERGDFDLARHHWTMLVPIDDGEDRPTVLRYPDTDLDLAHIRARLMLSSIALGERTRATQELAAFRKLHPNATGRIAGRDGDLAAILADELAATTESSSAEQQRGWDELPHRPATTTYGSTADRRGASTTNPSPNTAKWFRPLPRSPFATDAGRPALPPSFPLCYYPVVWNDKVFVADAERVFGFELATGDAAWAVSEDDDGTIYPPVVAEPGIGGDWFSASPVAGVPRHTLTVAGNRLFARLGPPLTSWPARELRRPTSSIVALDLERQGLLAWSIPSDSLGAEQEAWTFEGPPVAVRDRLYVLASRVRPQPRLHALCLDAATGTVLWNRPVGSPVTTPPDGLSLMTHRLLTYAAGRLYVQTDHGAVVCLHASDGRPAWVGWYESRLSKDDIASNAPEQNLPAACLYAGGVIVASPRDSDQLFAYDAASGIELWNHSLRGGASQLVGVRDGVLVVSGQRLWGVDLFTGRELWTVGFEDPPGYGSGRGLVAGPIAYWPAREDLFAVDVATGQVVGRLPLARLYGLTSGVNIAAAPDRLLLAAPDGLVALGE